MVLPRMHQGYGLACSRHLRPAACRASASLLAMKRLHLDRMRWLVTPGNP
jgi:hypothetical protein